MRDVETGAQFRTRRLGPVALLVRALTFIIRYTERLAFILCPRVPQCIAERCNASTKQNPSDFGSDVNLLDDIGADVLTDDSELERADSPTE
jgi:hypothetical protein